MTSVFSTGLWVQEQEEVNYTEVTGGNWASGGGGVAQNYRRRDENSGHVLDPFGWMVRATTSGVYLGKGE